MPATESSDTITLVVEPHEAGRVDKLLAARYPDASRRRLTTLFGERAVRINDRLAKKGDTVVAGDRVTLAREPTTDEALRARPDPTLALDVLHVDDHLVALAKPPGMPSQPLAAGELGCAVSFLVARFPECRDVGADPREAGLVHRLDVDTSGVLLAARTPAAWRAVREAFGAGAVTKSYLALVAGALGDRGRAREPLAQRGRRVVVDYERGLAAETTWQVQERWGDLALVECSAHTGRMHQIRAHLAAHGAPLLGDATYGGRARAGLVGHFLHAARIALPHPATGSLLTIDAPLPADRARILARLRAEPTV